MRKLVIIVIGLFFFSLLFLASHFYLPTSIQAQTATVAPTPDPCALQRVGDALCDGRIDSADFEQWRNEFLAALATKKGDFNKDDKVNLVDFEVWRKGFKGE